MKKIHIGIVFIILILISSFGSCSSVDSYSIYKKTELYYSNPIVLLTGFGPFGEYDVNPSQFIAENLSGEVINGANIVSIILPVNYTESVEVVTKAIEDYNPIIVVSTGLAPGSFKIRIEKIGLNLRFYDKWYILRRLDPNGPIFRYSSSPTYFIVRNIQKSGIPARISLFAGIYICNAVLYGVLDYIDEHNLQIKSGFIHVPPLLSQNPEGMELEKMINATTIAIQTCLDHYS